MPVPSFEDARAAVRSRLGASSAAHSEAVADTAAWLAERYCVDRDLARLAGVLHDWAREDGPERLTVDAERMGLACDETDTAVPYLLHARVGAVQVREVYPDVPDVVVAAVGRHTLGAEVMSDLDRIIYIADMIEPSRSFPGIGELRNAAREVTLEELYERAYALSLEHLVRSRKRIHPETVRAWNAIVGQRSR